jgi:hypothetical protein
MFMKERQQPLKDKLLIKGPLVFVGVLLAGISIAVINEVLAFNV